MVRKTASKVENSPGRERKTAAPKGTPDGTLLARIFAAQEAGRLPHALLFVGRDDACLAATARVLGEWLLGGPGIADSLDLFQIYPVGKVRQIPVDAIRGLIGRLHRSAHGTGRRIAIIHGADRLHRIAANALLKSLEEPPPGAFFLLTSTRPEEVLITIQSRCQRHSVHESVASGPRHSDWPTWLEDYGRFLRETARNRTTAAHCVSAYALGNRLRRILDELSPEDTPEEAARRVGERQAILDTLLADCSDRLLATTLDALPADGHGRRTAILRLSRHMAAIDRCLWFFAMHCSESAIFESMFLFPLIEGCRRRPLGFQ